MQKLMSKMRACIDKYNMISSGDKIAVAVSGGKDSVALLCALAEMRRFYKEPYSLHAITIDPCFGGKPGDYSQIEELCRRLGVSYSIKRTELWRIIFEIRKESNPCSLCSRMRRGALHDAAIAEGCNKVALGHHMDDAAETFFMNLFKTGQLSTFPPVHYMSRKDIHLIRPMVLIKEQQIGDFVHRYNLPTVKSECPADGFTSREDTKQIIHKLEQDYPDLKEKLIGAMQRSDFSGW